MIWTNEMHKPYKINYVRYLSNVFGTDVIFPILINVCFIVSDAIKLANKKVIDSFLPQIESQNR